MSDFVDDVNLMKWVHCFKKLPPESLKVRLLCLHWAGGNGMVYRPWSLKLNPLGIEVYTMNCPGRLNRAKEPLVTDLEVIKEKMYQCLNQIGLLDGDVGLVIFGHSLGATIGFELLKHIERHHGQSTVRHAILSAVNTPNTLVSLYGNPKSGAVKRHLLSDDDFILDMNELGGTDGIASELVRMSLPILRADFTAFETYRPCPKIEAWVIDETFDPSAALLTEHRVSTPLLVMGGQRDPFVTLQSCLDWGRYVIDGPGSVDDIFIAYKPDIPFPFSVEKSRSAAEGLCSDSDGQPEDVLPNKFAVYLNPEGNHFGILDKIGGGAEWTTDVITKDPDHAVHLTRRRLLERLEPDEVTMVDEEPYS